MARDWKNENDYDYTNDHTPELWAWEFLRRNPDYVKDWNKALRKYQKNQKKQIPHTKAVLKNKEKWDPVPGFSKAAYINDLSTKERKFVTNLLHSQITNNRTLDYLHFDKANSKWGLYIVEIINPAVDKPSFGEPYPLFYTYGYYWGKDDLDHLPDLKSTEVLALFDLAKPIPQQLDHFKALLIEDQNDSIAYTALRIPNVRNKSIYWKDYLRIFDAVKARSNFKEIGAVIYKNDDNPNNAQRKARNIYKQAEALVNGGYRHILQQPSKMKPR